GQVGLPADVIHQHGRSPAGLLLVARAHHGRALAGMVLDTLRRFHIEEENASGPMAQVIGRMEAIAADTGCS
ncbi:helicase RepA family protein, partial [Aeromonas caviae]|uniref:helicase RepA family protein n=1 Tax=Aeromonas caviae TaxID=648 RepID=UPI001CC58F4B